MKAGDFSIGMSVICTKKRQARDAASGVVSEEGREYVLYELSTWGGSWVNVSKNNETAVWFPTEAFELKRGRKMEMIKDYFKKHSEVFITIAIVVLIDEYLFGGSLREKIKSLLDKILNGATAKLEKEV